MNVQYLGNRKLSNEGNGGENSGKTTQATHVNDYDEFMNQREQTIPSTVYPERQITNL